MINAVDLLAFAAHPDDVELACCGTLLVHKKQGFRVGIIDLTRGELGTRGTAETRANEAEQSSKILQLDARENLGLADGFFEENEESLKAVIRVIRKYRPKIVLANSIKDRHPDHARGGKLVARACFLSGLSKIETTENNQKQEAYRPDQVYHYIQDEYMEPDLVVDISDVFDVKMSAIKAFTSQFYQEDLVDNAPTTPISGKDFMQFLEGRARQFGRTIKVEFGEGFTKGTPIGTSNLFQLK